MLQQLRRAKREQSGFTLIELLIVIVILGILAAVVVFAVNGIQDRGQQSACKADVSTVSIAAEAYNAQNGDYAPDMRTLVREGLLRSEPASKTYTVDYTVAADGNSVDVSSTFCSGNDSDPSSSVPTTVVAAPYCDQLRVVIRDYGSNFGALDEAGYGSLTRLLIGLDKAQPEELRGAWTTLLNAYTKAHQLMVDAGLPWTDLSAIQNGQLPNGISAEQGKELTASVNELLQGGAAQQAFGDIINTSQGLCGSGIFG